MVVYSNLKEMNEYVELFVRPERVRDTRTGQNLIGWGAIFHVYSRDKKYDAAVEIEAKRFLTERECMDWVRGMCEKFGLVEDIGLTHRRKVWGLK